MATIRKNMLTGILGPFILRVQNGKQRISAKPQIIRQTENTKNFEKLFGVSSKLTAHIIGSLLKQLPMNNPMAFRGGLYSPAVKSLRNSWNQETRRFNFEFNSFSPLNEHEFDTRYQVKKLLTNFPETTHSDNELVVTLPQFNSGSDLIYPEKSHRCDMIVGLSLFRLKDGMKMNFSNTRTFTIEKRFEQVGPFHLAYKIPNDCLCIVTLFLSYWRATGGGWKSLNLHNINPGVILKAIYTEGNYVHDPDWQWIPTAPIK